VNRSLMQAALPPGQNRANIRPEDLPLPWRGRPVPPELEQRLAGLNSIGDASIRQMRVNDEVNRFFIDQNQRNRVLGAIQARRRPLDQQPVTQPPLQIEIVPSPVQDMPAIRAPDLPNSPLTVEPQSRIKAVESGKEKP